MTTTALLWILALALVAVGTAGTVLPGLPGPPLVFAGLLLAAWINDFQQVGVLTLVLLGVLTALSWVVDLVATAGGAQRLGASRLAIAGAIIGTLIGLFFGLPGILLGPFAGAVLGELIGRGRLPQALKVGAGTWVGLLLGTLVRLALVCAMLAIFVLAYLL